MLETQKRNIWFTTPKIPSSLWLKPLKSNRQNSFVCLLCSFLAFASVNLKSASSKYEYKVRLTRENHSSALGTQNIKTFNLLCRLARCSQWHNTIGVTTLKRLPGLHKSIIMMRSVCRKHREQRAWRGKTEWFYLRNSLIKVLNHKIKMHTH